MQATIQFDRWKKFVFITELFPFKDNARDLNILKYLDKLWDCKYLAQPYTENSP